MESFSLNRIFAISPKLLAKICFSIKIELHFIFKLRTLNFISKKYIVITKTIVLNVLASYQIVWKSNDKKKLCPTDTSYMSGTTESWINSR